MKTVHNVRASVKTDLVIRVRGDAITPNIAKSKHQFCPPSTTSRAQEGYARYIVRNRLWNEVRVQTIHERVPELRSEEKWREAVSILSEGPNGSIDEEGNVNVPNTHWHVFVHTFEFEDDAAFVHFKLSV